MKPLSYYTIRIQYLPNLYINALMVMNNAPNIFNICIVAYSIFFLFDSTALLHQYHSKDIALRKAQGNVVIFKEISKEYLKKTPLFF